MKEMHSRYIESSSNQRGISQLNRKRLLLLHRDLQGPFTVDAAMHRWDTDRSETQRLLAHLTAQGWLVRVTRGIYATVPLDASQPDRWLLEPWVVATKVFAPCYIGGWSACEHWALTEQLFRSVVVVTAATNLRERHAEIQGTEYVLKTVSAEKLFGTRVVWLSEQRVLVSDPSRTLIDVLDDPALGGGIVQVANVLAPYFAEPLRDDLLLLTYAQQLGNKTVYKRLGYLIERLGIDAPDLLPACHERMSSGYSLLDPSAPQKGVRRRRWNLQINVTLPDEQATEGLPS
jgi:predicted transcriptional regulator of viral defense system